MSTLPLTCVPAPTHLLRAGHTYTVENSMDYVTLIEASAFLEGRQRPRFYPTALGYFEEPRVHTALIDHIDPSIIGSDEAGRDRIEVDATSAWLGDILVSDDGADRVEITSPFSMSGWKPGGLEARTSLGWLNASRDQRFTVLRRSRNVVSTSVRDLRAGDGYLCGLPGHVHFVQCKPSLRQGKFDTIVTIVFHPDAHSISMSCPPQPLRPDDVVNVTRVAV